ncbi:hypothetical protein FHX42_001499 [Saccharopolyspora lacisalsi]|uniref:DUF1990 domain-containing protein n=1 Tax=Halosaccharopolyspora lacisalsi TaxID=1000566 RepID=A0A839DTA4_9PSEU|nr:DUF1990 family protein [Halosaccharopolyspora lacisalsi]MBA8824170.1 hypothetical protein [Halosaccharopolyspora lacisalsi]
MIGVTAALGELLRWSPGVALATVRYFLHALPIHRVDEHEVVVVPELPEHCGPGIQAPQEGSGPVFHRRYGVRIHSSQMGPERLIERVRADPNEAVPREVAVFDRRDGRSGLRVGDELVVRMPGPWDGPVRVLDVGDTSFRLVTLREHLEAGQIEFRAYSAGDALVFEIESWARSGDWVVNLLYDGVELFKEMQTYLWAHYCANVCALSGGRMVHGVEVYTGCARGMSV